jgi:hypothetical protein
MWDTAFLLDPFSLSLSPPIYIYIVTVFYLYKPQTFNPATLDFTCVLVFEILGLNVFVVSMKIRG